MEFELDYIFSTKGNPMLHYKGFFIGDIRIVVKEIGHTHEARASDVNTKILLNIIKDTATFSEASTSAIVSRNVSQASESTKLILPKIKREHSLKTLYDDNEEFNRKMKMLAALSFVPPDEVKELFENLVEEEFATAKANVDNDLGYFQNTYIGNTVGRRVVAQLFSIDRWNHYNSVIDNLPRTNNSVEGWHRGFDFTIHKRGVNIFYVFKAFKADQALTAVKLTQIRTGNAPEPPIGRDICHTMKEFKV
ncbi:hypothetical protein TSAR_001294 [Trichomalopsis sarcophagae]|uniref:Uncharacterized protein n=1 Tax=Trichomalopsis sarcophagae TaxID=543379 RepID=A0A232FBF7_9HYME|nr:hypothetical protein TSAR_001294 [Trichomalopsis sarcophagae]